MKPSTPDLRRLRANLGSRYAVDREIGRGGTATVYLAEDLKHGRKVALKVLNSDLAESLGAKRFLREIRTAASLTHPHILPLHDSGEVDGYLYYVMPYVEEESLRERLARQKQLSLDEAVGITVEVAEALQYAHERGVIHRDVKPANILLSGHHAVLADFGIAGALEAAADRTTLTRKGIPLGTVGYMSPEQATGETGVDGRTDVYALGCVLYEALAGEPPFTGPTAQVILAKQLSRPVAPVSLVRDTLPEAIDDVLRRALARSPAGRFPSVGAFREALQAAVDDAAPPARKGRERRGPPDRDDPETSGHDPPARGLRLLRTLTFGGSRRVQGGLVVAAALVLIWLAFRSPVPPGEGTPEPGYLVQAHRTDAMTSAEETYTLEAAETLTRFLTGWKDVRVVPPVAQPGLRSMVGLSDPIRSSLHEGVQLASAARVATLVAVDVELRRDSALAQVTLFDVETERQIGTSLRSEGQRDDVSALMAPVASEILGLAGTAGASEALLSDRPSDNLEALQLLEAAVDSLDRWRLEAAERLLHAALEEDPVFPLAHHYLALTLYSMAVAEPYTPPETGGRIRRHATLAHRYIGRLRYQDSVHVEAFRALQEGQYERGRTLYGRLVEHDPTDTYAWLGLGSVEYHDPVTVRGPGGEIVPRADLGTAIEAFTTTVRLSPDFALGYDRLFEIYVKLGSMLGSGQCQGFEPPGAEAGRWWDATDPRTLVFRCPVSLDSIEWVEPDRRTALDRELLISGAERLLGTFLTEVERWLEYAPENPQPYRAMTRWLMARRDVARWRKRTTDPDTLARQALGQFQTALRLAEDTTSEDLLTLGSLHLAAGHTSDALRFTERAVGEFRREGARVPPRGANVYLLTGQLEKALQVGVSDEPLWIRDPTTGELYRQWVESEVRAMGVYGAVGIGGARVDSVLTRMDSIWLQHGYGAAETRMIKEQALPAVAPALASDSRRIARWFRHWDEAPSVWRGLMADEPAAADHWLTEALRDRQGVDDPVRVFLVARLAQKAGRHALAVTSFEDFRTMPLRVDAMSVAWGLRSLSLLYLARSLDAMGRREDAAEALEQFGVVWQSADPSVRRLLEKEQTSITAGEGRGATHP